MKRTVAAVMIRAALPADAAAISDLIGQAIREVNARDYAPDQIARTVANFSREGVLKRMATRRTIVALLGEEIIGTASLKDSRIYSVFVSPAHHGKGVGRALVGWAEASAVASGARELIVSSSLSAVAFYERLGYDALERQVHPDGDTITMRKRMA